MLYTHGYNTLLRASMNEWFRLLNFDYNHNAIDDSYLKPEEIRGIPEDVDVTALRQT